MIKGKLPMKIKTRQFNFFIYFEAWY